MNNPCPTLVSFLIRRVNARAGSSLLHRLPARLTRTDAVVDFRGIRVPVDSGEVMGRRLYYFREYEDVQVDAFLRLLRPGERVFDVGANAGIFSFLAARRGASVVAFEPSRGICRILARGVELNGLGAAITIVPEAVSESDADVVFYEHREGNLGVGRVFAYGPSPSPIRYPVRTNTLDHYAERFGPPGLIKMDIEGAEVLALRGGQLLLTGDEAPDLLIEFHPGEIASLGGSVAGCRGLLEDAGYRAYLPDASGVVNRLSTHEWFVFSKRPLEALGFTACSD